MDLENTKLKPNVVGTLMCFHGITTVEELSKIPAQVLLLTPNLGKAKLNEINQVLEDHGFPRNEIVEDESKGKKYLRDWFAGQALQGLLANHDAMRLYMKGSSELIGQKVSETAYAYADDMMKARGE